MTPRRIQRRRTKGWRMPEGAIYVGRPSLWGNPWTPSEAHAQRGFDPFMTARGKAVFAVDLYRDELKHFGLVSDYAYAVSDATHDALREVIDASGARNMAEYAGIALRGHDLACWCRLCGTHRDGLPLGVKCADCAPCHADVLLELANR